MGASVLIIDAEEEFANQLADALREQGAEVQISADGKAGLDAARINIPEAIVLCVELPRMSGYSICAKLKKDPTLKSVPLVITSAEATQETFDHHKKLKTRAEEYLKKPFEPAALVEVLSGHIGLGGDELPDLPIAEELAVEGEAPQTITDQEAFGTDGPFDGLSAPVSPPPLPGPHSDDLGSGAGLIDAPELEELDDEARTMVGTMPIMAQVQSLEAQVRELEEALEAARGERDEAIASTANLSATPSQVPTAASGREVLALKKELNKKERDLLELKDDLHKKDRQLLEARDEQMELEGKVLAAQEEAEGLQQAKAEVERQLSDTQGALEGVRADLSQAQSTAEELTRRLEEAERQAAERLQDAEGRAAELEGKLTEATRRGDQLQSELDARTQRVGQLEQEAADKASELERLGGELQEKTSEIDSLSGQNRALGSEVTRLGNELSASTAESDSLREQLSAAHADMSAAEERIGALENERSSAISALEETRQALSTAQHELEASAQREARSQEVRAKARQALEIAAALLGQEHPEQDDMDIDVDIPVDEPEIEVEAGQIEGEEASM